MGIQTVVDVPSMVFVEVAEIHERQRFLQLCRKIEEIRKGDVWEGRA